MTFFGTADPDLIVDAAPDRSRAATRVREVVWSHRIFWVLVAGLIVATTLAFARWQIAAAVVPWDSKNHFYPMFRFLGDALRHGSLPLWNPYQFGGYPAVADPQSLIFTPSMMLFAFLAPLASMPAFDAMIFAHLLAGGVGMLGLARRWRWHPAAALLAALIFMFGGSAAARLQHTGMIISYSFFPLALWSLQAALDRRSLRLAVVAGVAAALMALGRDQVAYLLCLALAGSVVRQACRAENAFAYLRSRAPVVLVAAGITVALMAIPILLTLQFLRNSNRPGVAYGMALEGSLDPINLLTLWAPNIFGSLDPIYDYWGPGAASIAGNDWTDRSIDYLFMGTLPAVLLAWHGLAGRRVLEPRARFFVLLVLCALFYAFGRHTPFFAVAFDWLPGVSLYRRPADATFIANVGLALLAGYLLHRFIEEGLPHRPASFAGLIPGLLVMFAAALLVGFGLSFSWHAGHLSASFENLMISACAVGAVAAVLYIGQSPAKRQLVATLLVVITAGQLVWSNASSPLNAEPASTYSAYNGFYPDQAKGLAVLQAELATRRARGDHPRVEIIGLDGSWQNASMVLKLENTVGYNPLRIADYERAVGVAESANDIKLRTFPDTFRGYNSRLAALLGLDYLVLDRSIADLPRHMPRPRASLLFAGDHFYVYRLEGSVAQRVTFATRIRPIDSDDAIESGALPQFEIGHEALADQDDVDRSLRNPSLLRDGEAGEGSTAAIISYSDNRVLVDVHAAVAGLLVLHDLIYPGWEARVDGAAAPLLRSDLLFRGVEVDAGHHTVEFSYHPFSFANLTAAAGCVLRREKS